MTATTRGRPKKVPAPPRMVSFPLRFSEADHALLKAIAAREDRTLQSVVTRALRAAYPEFDQPGA